MIVNFVKEKIEKIEEIIPSIYQKMESPCGFDRIILVGKGIDYAVAHSAREAFVKYSGISPMRIEVSTEIGLINFMGIQPIDEKTLIITPQIKDADCFGSIKTIETLKDIKTDGDYDRYFTGLLSMILLAKKIGGDSDFQEIYDYMNKFSELLDSLITATDKAAEIFADGKTGEVISSGPDYGGGYFSRILCYKAKGLVTTIEEVEDWLHVNYLQLNPEDPICLYFVTKDNPAFDRAIRTLKYVKGIKRKFLVITDDRLMIADYDIAQLPTANRWLVGLLSFVPVAMILEK